MCFGHNINRPKLLYYVLFESNGREPAGKKSKAKSRLGREENIHDGRQDVVTSIGNNTELNSIVSS